MEKFKLTKIRIRNAFSFKDAELDLGKLNIIVGPNASGKTNLVNVFRLLKRALGTYEEPRLPYLPWWSPRNIAYNFSEETPVQIELNISDEEGHESIYALTFSVAGGEIRLVRETLQIKGYCSIERYGDIISVCNNIDEKAAKRIYDDLVRILRISIPTLKTIAIIAKELQEDIVNTIMHYAIEVEQKHPLHAILLEKRFTPISPEGTVYNPDDILRFPLSLLPVVLKLARTIRKEKLNKKEIPGILMEHLSPLALPSNTFLNSLRHYIRSLFEKSVILRPLNYTAIRSPVTPRKETALTDDASNLVSYLYNLYISRRKEWDELHELFNMYFFPEMKLAFRLTETGQVILAVHENDRELLPPNVPEGAFKVLALLVAIVSKAPLIVVDEIENSLHPKFIEALLDLIRESNSMLIATTHSPAVVDAANVEEIVVVERGPEGSKFSRIPEPERIKKWLRETQVTVSEYVFYGG